MGVMVGRTGGGGEHVGGTHMGVTWSAGWDKGRDACGGDGSNAWGGGDAMGDARGKWQDSYGGLGVHTRVMAGCDRGTHNRQQRGAHMRIKLR